MLLSPPPKMQFFGDDGLPLSGGLVYTYSKDTTTPLATYTDSTGSVANANPVVLDAYGFASIWFQILPYSLVIQDSLGVVQGSSGPIEFSQAATSGSDIAAWSDIVVYDYPDQVAGSDGYTYRCVGTNILDDDPVGSVTGAWVNLSSLASAALTGTPTAPTAAAGTNTTQIATCAFTQTAIATVPPRAEIVSGVPITGGIYGGNITASGNTLTITATSCIDSTLTTKLYTTESKTVTIPSAASTIYHIFLVKLVADDSFEFRAYTTEAGVASDAEVSKYRWYGFWRTNSANACVAGIQAGEYMLFAKASENVVSNAIGVTYATVDHSSFIPVSRVELIEYGVRDTSENAESIYASLDGTNVAEFIGYQTSGSGDTSASAWHRITEAGPKIMPLISTMQFRSSSGTLDLLIHKVKVKR